MRGSDLVRLEGVSCRYGSEAVLDRVDLNLSPREFIGVVGPSGSGKTSLLRAILGTLQPAAGRVVRRAGPAGRLRAPGRDGQLELPGHREPVRADGPRAAGACALGEPRRARRGGRGARRGSASASSASATSASCRAASSSACSSPARSCSGPSCCCSTSRPRASTCACATRCCTCSTTSTRPASRSCSPPTTSTASPPTCRASSASTAQVIGVGPPREVLTEEVLERTYGASMEVLEHGGMMVVVDAYATRPRRPAPRTRAGWRDDTSCWTPSSSSSSATA